MPAFEVREAEAHTIELLPYLHSEDDLDRLFLLLRVSPPGRMWRTGSRPRGVKGALMVAWARRPELLTGARGVCYPESAVLQW